MKITKMDVSTPASTMTDEKMDAAGSQTNAFYNLVFQMMAEMKPQQIVQSQPEQAFTADDVKSNSVQSEQNSSNINKMTTMNDLLSQFNFASDVVQTTSSATPQAMLAQSFQPQDAKSINSLMDLN